MRDIVKPVIILSAFRKDLTDTQNMQRHTELESSLGKLKFANKVVVGCYKGVKELSYVIPYNDVAEELVLISLGEHFNQECVLKLDDNRNASLLYTNGSQEPLGHFHPITEKDALERDNYTFSDGIYYGIK
jgi:hypothetical protein